MIEISKRSGPGKQRTAATGSARPSSSVLQEHSFQLKLAVIGGVFAVIAALTGAWAAGVFNPRVPPTAPSPTGPLMPGDVSVFIRDVTYPDYSKVYVDEHFTKIWELRDAGTVRWAGRYLTALGPSSGTCTYPPRVKVPATDPGETVDISVSVIAPSSPGMCYVTWRMVSSNGVLYFPNDTEGIWFKVVIVAKRSS